MDSSFLNTEILKEISLIKAKSPRGKPKKFPESEELELIGFMNGKNVLKKTVKNSSETHVDLTRSHPTSDNKSNSKTGNLKVTMSDKKQESQPLNETTSKNQNTREVKLQKIIVGSDGKKYIILNGKKVQIVKNTSNPNVLKTNAKIMDLFPKNISTTTELKVFTPPSNKSGNMIESSTNSNIQPPLNISFKHRNLLPKLTGKIISINKNEGFQNLSLIMKEVGGSIRLVNRQNKGNPPVKENILSGTTPTNYHTTNDPPVGNMETNQCTCKKNQKLVASSTNTEQIETVHKGVQTENLSNNQSDENDVKSPISDLYKSGVIIGADVNMGHGPPSIYTTNKQNTKMKFFNDLQRCLKWESGNLPIHRSVIEQDVNEVMCQCFLLKVRKAGINIVNINNYTPLQLAVINDVNVNIVKILLEYSADLSVLDSEGNNVLHLAVEHNRTSLVRIFLDKLGNSDLDINHFNYDGLTPLMMCAFHVDRIDMAEQFLKKNAMLNLKDLKSGRTALFHAAESHNAPMVSLLLDYGADTKIRNFFGTSVHDAMFELDDIPKEIKYPILGRDLKVHEKRKLHQQKVRKQESFKRKRLEIVSTVQKLKAKASFVSNKANVE